MSGLRTSELYQALAKLRFFSLSLPSNGGEEARLFDSPLSSILPSLVPRGERKKTCSHLTRYARPASPTKFSSNLNPTPWLFSGWNCVAKTLSRQMAEAKGPA